VPPYTTPSHLLTQAISVEAVLNYYSTDALHTFKECELNNDIFCMSPTDHYIVINLRQHGKVIATKETKGVAGPNPVWNAPFLFDLPAGDITELPLVLEFIVMQVRFLFLSTGSCAYSLILF